MKSIFSVVILLISGFPRGNSPISVINILYPIQNIFFKLYYMLQELLISYH